MPGRHGKQRIKKKKSKRLPVTEMEKTLKDSIHGRKRKEKEILKQLIAPLTIPKVKKPIITSDLPMFSTAPAKESPSSTLAVPTKENTSNNNKNNNKSKKKQK